MLIFKRLVFRCRCVCDSIWQFSILSSRGALRRRISCASTLSFIALCSRDPSLRSGWHDKKTDDNDGLRWIGWRVETQTFHVYRKRKHFIQATFHPFGSTPFHSPWRTGRCVKGDSSTRQGAFMNSSRSFHQNIKDSFKKFFIYLKEPAKCFTTFSLKNKQLYLVYIINLIIFANKKARRNASKPSFSLFKAIDSL